MRVGLEHITIGQKLVVPSSLVSLTGLDPKYYALVEGVDALLAAAELARKRLENLTDPTVDIIEQMIDVGVDLS